MDPADQTTMLYALQDEFEPDRALLDAPFDRITKKTGKEINGVNQQVALYLEGDLYCYFKPLNGVDVTTADAFGHTLLSSTLAECAAWRLAHRFGDPFDRIVIPQVLRKLPAVDERAPGALARRHEGKTNRSDPFEHAREYCVAAAFFDSLIGQQDRNKNNWLWDERTGQLKLLDHGFAFGRPGDETVNLRFSQWRWKQKEEDLLEAELEVLTRLLESDDLLGLRQFFDEDRCDALSARATQMRDSRKLMPNGEL